MKITLEISDSALRKIRQYYNVQCLIDAGERGLSVGTILADKILQAAESPDKIATIQTKD